MQKIIAILLFILPSRISMPLAHLIGKSRFTYAKGARIGFSLLLAEEIHLGEDARIGHFNFIKCISITLGRASKIKYFNILKGRFILKLGSESTINQFNKITSLLNNIRESCLSIEDKAIVGVKHTIDLSHNITIGRNSILAGVGSQLWTHGFYHPSTTTDHWRIDGEINIGENVYVGSNCIINAGVDIANDITIGAGGVVSKSLKEKGLYCNQPLRQIDFTPESSITHHKHISGNYYEKVKK